MAIPPGSERDQVSWQRVAAPDIRAGAITTTAAAAVAVATLAIGGTAQATLAPGTP